MRHEIEKRRQTWKRLIEIEPMLELLRLAVAAVKDDGTSPYFCANEWWYGRGDHGFKGRMSRLVGWTSDKGYDPFLRTQEAYDVAYDVLYNELPNCRNCGCYSP